MAAKKLPKNLDLANNVDVAAGFFSSSSQVTDSDKKAEPITITPDEKEIDGNVSTTKKNLGGRPKKDGLKNEQFTLTMNPELYEKLRYIANDNTRGNISGLIEEAIKSFCRERNIDLSAIQVPQEVLEMYKQKQIRKSKKK